MAAFPAIPLPPVPRGWFDYRHYLLSDGALGLLRTDRDINTDHRAWLQKALSGDTRERQPDFWAGKARLSILGPRGESAPIAVPLVRYPEIDRLPDGRWVVVSARAEVGDANATILAPDGRPSHSFAVGDGVQHVRCAPDGTIWVGYFDEGIFGDTLGSGGIVRFADDGRSLWSYNDEARRGKSFSDDCYALTLAGDEVWTCFYSDFPIARIVGGEETRWTNRVSGATALAVDGAYVLLAGGYSLDRSRLTLVELQGARARRLGSYRLPVLAEADLVQGRSDSIHIVGGAIWSRLTVAEARAALG